MLETVQEVVVGSARPRRTAREELVALLAGDLDFHDQASGFASHNFHSFPAKFPPQLPRKFIYALSSPREVVLDPMVGSGTTILEAYLSGRQAIGVDIDPLAMLISKVKVAPASVDELIEFGDRIALEAKVAADKDRARLEQGLETRWDARTKQFIDNWFASETQLELLALLEQIVKLSDTTVKSFFLLAFSSIIITKSGGVSLALDLGHTRPHKAKLVRDRAGYVIVGNDADATWLAKNPAASKTIGSPIHEFTRRFRKNLEGVVAPGGSGYPPFLTFGNAQCLPIASDSIRLIVTSPPYACNAIDYMRAHKFSLVWLGHTLDGLTYKRKDYIGGEAMSADMLEPLPDGAGEIVAEVGHLDNRKGKVLHRYYSEMTCSLREMFRVLQPQGIAVVVVGSSVMRGRNTETGHLSCRDREGYRLRCSADRSAQTGPGPQDASRRQHP